MESRQDNAQSIEEYNTYLVVMAVMSSVVLGLSLYQLSLKLGQSFPYRWWVLVLSFVSAVIPVIFVLPRDPFFRLPISLVAKKWVLVAFFTLYLFALSLLTVWAGGANSSPHGNLVLLTATFSAFIARKPKTKIALSVLASVSYVLSSVFYFNTESSKIEQNSVSELTLYFVIMVIVVVISCVSSIRIEESRRNDVS